MQKYIIGIFILFFSVFINAVSAEGNTVGYNNTKINTKNIKKIQSNNVSDLFSGAGIYSINLSFPKGPLNIIPKLSFNYNSYSTDSFTPYGYAWNMNLDRINRDSKRGTTGIYTNNKFVINGEELVLIDLQTNLYKSKYTNNLNKYYFENNTWRVVDSKGNTFYYGTIDNSKLSDPNNSLKTYAWNLVKQIDNMGNEIVYNYFKDNNQVYLDNIEYAGVLYKIQFNYIEKAKSLVSYRTHFPVKTSKLLNNIVFYINNEEVKKYELGYDNINNVFSHLTSFKEKSGTNIKSKYNFVYGTGKDIHLLKQIIDNKGLQVDFEYKPSVFYKDEEGNNLNPKLPFNIKTLHKISYLDTVTNVSNTDIYEYAGGSFYFDSSDLYGRQYAGFNKVTKIDSLGKKEINYFHQGANSEDYPELGEFEDHISKKGKIFRKEIYDFNGELIQSEIIKYKTEFEGANRWKVLKDRETKNLINGTNITSSAIEYSYDIYSNILEKTEYGEVNLLNEAGDFEDILTDKKITKFTYSKSDLKNLYGFVKSTKIFDFSNNLVNKKEILYDNQSSGSVDFGNITSTKVYNTLNTFSETKNEYSTGGLLIKTINPRLYEINYLYDEYGIYPINITNAKGFIDSYKYDYKSGKPSKHVNVNGLETTYIYDNFGRLLSEKIILDNEYTTKEIVYDDISLPNNIKQTIYFDKIGVNKQDNFSYKDGFGNEIQTKKSFEDKYITLKNEYNSRGNKVFTSYSTFENNSNYTVLDKQTEFGNVYVYDDLNRVIKITNTSGDITYDYNNLNFSITNQKGIITSYKYDIFGNLIQVTEPGNKVTTYSYNTLGQLTKVIDSQNNLRNISYDISGKRLEIEDLHKSTDTNFGSRQYEYDKNGNIVKHTTMSGDDITYVYDSLDRLISETSPQPSPLGGEVVATYTYDSGTNSKGLLSSYSKGDYSENFSYDKQGNIVTETKTYGTDSYNYNYTYNLTNQKTSQTYPDGKITNYTFEDGIEKGVNYDGTELVKTVNYNPVLKPINLKYGNDAITANVYDHKNAYRLTSKGLVYSTNQYGLTYYTFDELGNITNLKEQGNIPQFQKDVTYSYDNLNRLTQADYSPSEIYNYTYDSLGNILSNSNIGNYTYADNGRNNPHAVTSIGTINYSYDNNGNVVLDDKGSYVYNAKDELTSFTDTSGNTTSYRYNSNGVRVEKVNGNNLNRYLNKDYELNISGTGTGQIVDISKYIFFNGKKLVTVKNETITYHHSDHLGGANIDLDSNGNILQNIDYLPFGEIRNEYNYGSYNNKYKFTGKERDIESNLDYFEARYYGSNNGRFRGIDRVFWEVGGSKRGLNALSFPQKQNSYSYVGNNPLIYTDNTGEWWDTAIDTVVAIGGMGIGKLTGDKYLVKGAQTMFKDTAIGALNPLKKLQKVKKLSKIFDKIKISRQKQNRHIKGTKEYMQALEKGEIKSTWKNPNEADKLTKEAWDKGSEYKGKSYQKIYETNKQVGNNVGETKIQVHKSKTGLHGNPHK